MIRKVETLEEANKCDELLNKLILDEKKYDNTINENFVVNNYFSKMINNENNILLIDIIDDKIIAYVFAKKIYDESIDIGYLIDGLYVEQEYRNRGIAKNLINEIIKICENNNASYIDINVMYNNTLAKKLYKSLEFNELKLTLRKKLN